MLKAFKYRIYPTKAQRSKMEQTLELCRWTYNETLAYRKNSFEQEGKSVSKYETHNLLPEWKKNKPELTEVFSQTLQNVQERVDLAFKAFFRRVKAGEAPGYPRFKGKGWYDSFTYPQLGFKLSLGKLRLSKIGDIKIKLHRPIEGKIKRLTVRRSSTGKWFACFSVEIDDPPKPPWKDGLMAGIDVGLESFATLSNGEKIDNPRFFRSEEKALAKAQRRLSKYEKGTPERWKALKVVQQTHERIANRRYDFAHQVSHNLVERFGLIAFEDLSITNMLKNHCLAKGISDAAWRMLVITTSYKAESAGSKVVLVDPRNTSQLCSRCGLKVNKSLSDRVHECPQCGLVMDRDENAAINILRLGLQSLPKARSSALQGGE
ncbi:RNA-guided endonuclease InsQ/TnpB family protein [Methanothrix harundinacea]|uniref:Transposase, IS605 OrfB family n=1 Tax=Methanothrix harundinacea (strain 6Ac) TaxID=1110509 RepID=G7WQ38_METH6|nr:RNA-guided endonuclease TnpB family protein [Methanothrix harundinacea]AET65230.1 Transposase, IS605 OrfB family [Methanothrix harundinacea 6Ac]